jgi:hypothetical protein
VGAGATDFQHALDRLRAFQSSPARGGGCNARRTAADALRRPVSILTRPWGRVQRWTPASIHGSARWFQSSPARGGGCNGGVQRDALHLRCFNPHPPVGAGATSTCNYTAVATRSKSTRFNPHPPVGAGATKCSDISVDYRSQFQSSPDAERAQRAGRSVSGLGFNPHPPVGAGATSQVQASAPITARRFNPHPPVGAGATRLGERAGAVPQTQVFQLSRCAVPRSGRLTAGHSPTDTRYAASRPWAGCPLAPSSR